MPSEFFIISKLSTLILGAALVATLAVNKVCARDSNRILIDRIIDDLRKEVEFFRSPLEDMITRLKAAVELIAQGQAAPGLMRSPAHCQRIHV